MLDLATVLALAADCAPNTSSRTLAAIAYAESRFDPLAIGVNEGPALARRPSDRPQAVRVARARIAAGGDIDLGLAQINSANLGWLRLSVEDAFDPCRNLQAASVVLSTGFNPSGSSSLPGQAELRRALSRYNTGHPTRGFANGYVARVEAAARRLFGADPAPATSVAERPTPAVLLTAEAPAASWDVFGRAADGASRRPSTFSVAVR